MASLPSTVFDSQNADAVISKGSCRSRSTSASSSANSPNSPDIAGSNSPLPFGLPETSYPVPQLDGALKNAEANQCYPSAFVVRNTCLEPPEDDVFGSSFLDFFKDRKIQSDPLPVVLRSTTESETSEFIPSKSGVQTGSEVESEENSSAQKKIEKNAMPEIQYPAMAMTVRRTFLEPQDEELGSLVEFLQKRETKSCPVSRIQMVSAVESETSEFIPQCPGSQFNSEIDSFESYAEAETAFASESQTVEQQLPEFPDIEYPSPFEFQDQNKMSAASIMAKVRNLGGLEPLLEEPSSHAESCLGQAESKSCLRSCLPLASAVESETSEFVPQYRSVIDSEFGEEDAATEKEQIPDIEYPAPFSIQSGMTVRNTFLEPQSDGPSSLADFIQHRGIRSCPGSRMPLNSAADSEATEPCTQIGCGFSTQIDEDFYEVPAGAFIAPGEPAFVAPVAPAFVAPGAPAAPTPEGLLQLDPCMPPMTGPFLSAAAAAATGPFVSAAAASAATGPFVSAAPAAAPLQAPMLSAAPAPLQAPMRTSPMPVLSSTPTQAQFRTPQAALAAQQQQQHHHQLQQQYHHQQQPHHQQQQQQQQQPHHQQQQQQQQNMFQAAQAAQAQLMRAQVGGYAPRLPAGPNMPPPLAMAPLQTISEEVPPPPPKAPLLRIAESIQICELPVGTPECPTIGSRSHGRTTCKPCAFFRTKGCGSGVDCKFCHLCLPGEKKRRQKAKSVAYKLAGQGMDPEDAVATAASWAARSAKNAEQKLRDKLAAKAAEMMAETQQA